MKTTLTLITHMALLVVPVSLALAQQPTAQERVVSLKASLAASQVILKQYEWVETTVVSLEGKEKSRLLNRCYHGADGKVQKIPLSTPPPPAKKRGLRGRIAAAKTEELTDYMKEAIGLVKLYLPPDPARLETLKNSGKVTLQPLPGQRVRLTFADYLKDGDSFSMDLDLTSNRPVEAKVATYLNSPKETVTLDVRFGTLDTSATYPANVVLDAPGKKLKVTVENSGYRKQ